MKSTYFCVLLVVVPLAILAQEPAASTTQAKDELKSALAILNRAPASNSDDGHPGWREQNNLLRLRRIADKYPNTEEAKTALLWLATVDIENAQTNAQRAVIRQRATNTVASLEGVIQQAPQSWQTKAARLKKCHAFFLAQDWTRLEQQGNEILNSIDQYTQEKAAGYVETLEIQKVQPSNIEPELRLMLLVGASIQERWDEALQRADYLQQRFPQWSQKSHIDSIIDSLKRRESPFRLPK